MSDFISNWTNDRRQQQQQQQPTIKMMEKYRMLFFSSIYVTIISNNHRHALVYATGHARTPMHIAGNIIQNKHRNETNLVSVERIRRKKTKNALYNFYKEKYDTYMSLIAHGELFSSYSTLFFQVLSIWFTSSDRVVFSLCTASRWHAYGAGFRLYMSQMCCCHTKRSQRVPLWFD